MSFSNDFLQETLIKNGNKKNLNRKKRKRSLTKQAKAKTYAKNILRHDHNSSRQTVNMSAWAENYAFIATWQQKHEAAYWKAKATALEYENQRLHSLVRKLYLDNGVSNLSTPEIESEIDSENEQVSQEESEEGLEVSEEYIKFLAANYKYKEDAKREKEKWNRSNLDPDITKILEAGPSEDTSDWTKDLKELYGDKWQRISALETSVLTNFISECDKNKPKFWPNIPLNL